MQMQLAVILINFIIYLNLKNLVQTIVLPQLDTIGER